MVRALVVRVGVIVVAGGVLAGCAGRPGPDALMATEDNVPGTTEHVILVASAREPDPRPGVFYSGERADKLSFARIDMTVPPTHKPGMVEFPKQGALPNPATDMVVRDAVYRQSGQQFVDDLKGELAKRPKGDKDIFIFVHGYNTLFSEALYRFAQLAEDSKSPAVPVLFTWASRGSTADYVYDSNSATAARDELEKTIRLAFDSGAEQVSILAHSMGNWVTVEALRQIAISGKALPEGKIGNIILASPDIDVDVFKTQLARFRAPHKPFIVVVSRDDKALGLSDFIAGGKPRLGAYTNDEDLVKMGAVVVDMTDVKAQDGFNHGKFTQLAEMAPELRGMVAGAAARKKDEVNVAGIQFHGLDRFTLSLPKFITPAAAATAPPVPATGAPDAAQEAAQAAAAAAAAPEGEGATSAADDPDTAMVAQAQRAAPGQ
ncbi:alpha/beta hydrolase [Ancylobacter mangrovi]|uniref:alpha/beta hydrolase n=1 Tax=Ancylobacter mangrovi TaxID=2972472 RepID=UPI002162A7B6|nr:alpha/beta hydrolase [Ancylobacter mangrovi]